MDRLGARVEATPDRDHMLLRAQVPSKKVAECIRFLAELFTSPSFPASEVAKEKASQKLEYEKIRQDPMLASILDSWEATFPSNPLGHPVTGYPKTIDKLTPKILEKFDADTRREASLVIAITGPQNERELIDHAHSSFEKIKITPHTAKLKLGPDRDFNVLKRQLKVKQTTLSVGMVTPGASTPEYPALLLIEDYLGSERHYFGVLFNELRQKRGLTYFASTKLSALRQCGLLTAFAGVKHEKVSEALSLMLKFTVELRDNIIPEKKVEQLKIFHKQVMRMILEVPSQAATWLATNVFRGGKINFESYASDIDSVTPEAIRDAAARFLKPSHMALSVAGSPPDEKTLTDIMREEMQ
jgi:zinc protease